VNFISKSAGILKAETMQENAAAGKDNDDDWGEESKVSQWSLDFVNSPTNLNKSTDTKFMSFSGRKESNNFINKPEFILRMKLRGAP